MSIKRRLRDLERAIGPKSRVHFVHTGEWPQEEQERYERATQDERAAMLSKHLPDFRDGDVVIFLRYVEGYR